MRKHLIATALIFLWLALSQGVCLGAEYYLDAYSGNDTYNGEAPVWDGINGPWKTLGQAQSVAQGGDYVILLDGNYGSFSESNVSRSNWLTYEAYPGDTPTLDQIYINNSNQNSYLVFDGFEVLDGVSIHYSSYVQVRNCNIRRQPEPYEGFYAPYFKPGLDGIEVRGSYYIVLEDNEIRELYRGIDSTYDSPSNVLIKNNTIHYIGEDGIAVSGDNVTIEGNHIFDTISYRTTIDVYGTQTGNFYEGENVTLDGTGAKGIALRYHNNIYLQLWQTSETNFYDEWFSGRGTVITGQESGATLTNIYKVDPSHTDGIQIHSNDIDNLTITKNVIHGGMWNGIKLATYEGGMMRNVTVSNNLIYDSMESNPYSMYMENFGTFEGVNIYNNTFYSRKIRLNYYVTLESFYNNIVGLLIIDSDKGNWIKNHGNNIFAETPSPPGGPTYPFAPNTTELVNYPIDTLFTDVASRDFHLAENSLARDFGDPLYAPLSDIEGNPRDAYPDAGCYEYVYPGTTYYVDAAGGNDANPGTSAEPWATLDRAYTWYSGPEEPKVQEGDTVLFRTGDYGSFVESTNVNPGENYLFYRNNWVTYKAAPGHTPGLDSITIHNLDKWGGLGNGDSYLVFDGFQIADQVDILYTSYVKVLNCTIQGTPAAGVSGYYEPYFVNNGTLLYTRDANYITLQGNDISQGFRGINASGSNFLIKNNTIHHISEDAIVTTGVRTDCLVEGNYTYDHRTFTTVMDLRGTRDDNFIEGEVVKISDVPAVTGIYSSNSSAGIWVYPTSQVTFWDYETSAKTVVGESSGATLVLADVDPPHVDSFQFDSSSVTTGLVIRNNIFDRERYVGVGSIDGQGLKVWGYNLNVECEVYNNLIIGIGAHLFQGMNNSKIFNNTILGTKGLTKGLTFRSTNGDSVIGTFYNNIVEECSLSNENGHTVTINSHGNNIFKEAPVGLTTNETEMVNYDIDTLFVDAANNDFHLTGDSLARDFADPAYAPAEDIEGNLRNDGAPDIGCYEYTASTFMYGDVNGNNEVTALDAALVAGYAVGLETFTTEQLQKADVTGNVDVTSYDASWIARRAVNPALVFPVEQ